MGTGSLPGPIFYFCKTLVDLFTVEDKAPSLQSDQGYFYITAASYNGERRYGRQSLGGLERGVIRRCCRGVSDRG